MMTSLLGGLGAQAFLRRHWQKKLMLARGALPQYGGLITPRQLFRLAGRSDVQSRLVARARGRWSVEHGPFSGRRLARLPARGWTLLVQGVDSVWPQAQQLLLEFDFIPFARLDDVMVSYAPPGGGVGPHYDSYDVFLLQIGGVRRWQTSGQADLELVPGAPLRLLRRFRPEREWLLQPGDMLYLPPRIAHDGTAVDECMTASVGFRAPDAQELGVKFLEFLQDELSLAGEYRDAELRVPRHPAHIGNHMLHKMQRVLERIDWTSGDVERFAGCYLTEPGAHLFFTRPERPLSRARFASRIAASGLRLDPGTRMLFRGRYFFINGECCEAGREAQSALQRLADRRRLPPPVATGAEAVRILYQWYRAGYILPGTGAQSSRVTRNMTQ